MRVFTMAVVALFLLVVLCFALWRAIGDVPAERRAQDAERLAKRSSLSGAYVLPPGCPPGDMHVGMVMSKACVTEPNTLHHMDPIKPLTESSLTWVRYGDNAVALSCRDAAEAASPYRTGCLIRGYIQDGFGPDAVVPARRRLIVE